MLKTKVKISQITNLTDARYFAAMGADYLGFTIHPDEEGFVAPPILKEIVEWVEGPETVLETAAIIDEGWLGNYRSFLSEYFLESALVDLQPDFLCINDPDAPVNDQECFVVYQSDVPWNEQKSTIENLVEKYPDRLFLDIPFATVELKDVLSTRMYGLVLRGGEEEKVGYKSYDDLDEIFDQLMD
jgi:phosphoribosylanthranilate isomerase